jgi:hypothetical protein
LVVVYGNGELTWWIQKVKHTALLLLTVSIWRRFGQEMPSNSRTIWTSLSTAIPQKQVRTTKIERMTINSTLRKH